MQDQPIRQKEGEAQIRTDHQDATRTVFHAVGIQLKGSCGHCALSHCLLLLNASDLLSIEPEDTGEETGTEPGRDRSGPRVDQPSDRGASAETEGYSSETASILGTPFPSA
ncbi:MAG: hypothetical protein A2V83_00855 [Nitrospirae bacterium RBG_16_64_22]|nr:MAG: hypothetical protein A2V83_00855 [Nitrospirae bacterium RBG_16_64_22]